MIRTHLKNVFRKFLFCFRINDSYLFKSLALAKIIRPYRLFIGNSGAGKSTLANCIARCILFKSGGRSGTPKFDQQFHDGIYYLDTPGLQDVVTRRRAAIAITEALRQNGNYQIFFVLTLNAGKLRPEDLTTIWLVLLNAPEITCFNIIINNVSKIAHDCLRDDNKISRLLAPLESMGAHKYRVLILPSKIMLEDADNKIVDFPELDEFVEAAQWVDVHPSMVNDISRDCRSFQEKMDSVISNLLHNHLPVLVRILKLFISCNCFSYYFHQITEV